MNQISFQFLAKWIWIFNIWQKQSNSFTFTVKWDMFSVFRILINYSPPEVKSKHVVLSGNLQVGECLCISASHGISWVDLLDGLTTCKGAMLIQSVGWELIWSCWKRPHLSSVRFFPWLGWGFPGILISEKLNFRHDGTLAPSVSAS